MSLQLTAARRSRAQNTPTEAKRAAITRLTTLGASTPARRAPATAASTVTSHNAAMAPIATEMGWPNSATPVSGHERGVADMRIGTETLGSLGADGLARRKLRVGDGSSEVLSGRLVREADDGAIDDDALCAIGTATWTR